MTRVERLLSQYAAYHLDRKNVMTHFIGVPLIVFFHYLSYCTCITDDVRL